jgi:hypothetical protein
MAIKFIIERRKKKWATIKDFPTLFPSSVDLDLYKENIKSQEKLFSPRAQTSTRLISRLQSPLQINLNIQSDQRSMSRSSRSVPKSSKRSNSNKPADLVNIKLQKTSYDKP